MKTKYFQQRSMLLILMVSTLVTGYSQSATQTEKQKSATGQSKNAANNKATRIVTVETKLLLYI